ncbi:glycosyltransferase family 4 protein [Alteromonas ponticola]|uniref:Glycosyltransferase family 4 protein n=1 Tax=Alteromonas aquimaris TaxID=2998417 RepID=A0ABT3P3C6_9ALTE|nr:glycosyltransferase family 4 protein [Alteromonas aquimaris]MCW8107258.1 glycosyltransferase family 4 protein [Alteromonas aquimaris]
MSSHSSILCVANWPSDVGYAWWLMESYWVKISELYQASYTTIIAYPQINTVPAEIANSDIELVNFDFRATTISRVIENINFIKKHNVKVIYLSDYGAADITYALYRLAGVEKIIVHDHTPGLRTKPKGLKKFLKLCIVNMPLIKVDAAFGATDYVKRRLQDVSCVAPSRCYSIQNGIDFSPNQLIREPHPLSAKLPKDKKIIVTASRANKYKGIEFALDVVAELVNRRGLDNFVYLFCGDGPDLAHFKEYAKQRGIESYCYFPGRVEKVQQLFKNCHIAFHPSNGEVGYSLAILEYMASELPVVVPDNPSVCLATRDKQSGQVYKDKDKERAAEALALYLEDEQMRVTHGKVGKSDVIEKYTLTSTHTALENAFLNVVRR